MKKTVSYVLLVDHRCRFALNDRSEVVRSFNQPLCLLLNLAVVGNFKNNIPAYIADAWVRTNFLFLTILARKHLLQNAEISESLNFWLAAGVIYPAKAHKS